MKWKGLFSGSSSDAKQAARAAQVAAVKASKMKDYAAWTAPLRVKGATA